MTVWFFYYIDRAYDNYKRLYAFTDNREYANEFIKQRSKENMICRKEKGISKLEYKRLEADYGKLKLIYGSFYTKSNQFGRKVSVKVLCTPEEEECIVIKSEHLWEEYSKYLFDTRGFKKEYLQALEKLLFLKFYGFYKIKYLQYADYFYQPYYSSFGPVEGLIVDDFKTSFEYDELKVFLKFYQNTFHNDTKIDYSKDTEFEW